MSSPRPRRLSGVALAGAVALAISHAHAEPTAEERAAARTLFDEGRALMASGKYPEACPKLEESLRIDPGVGTQYNLADCQEHTGKLASAWANFLDAASRARAAKQDERADAAKERAQALAPRLAKIVILARDPAGTLTVKRDGVVVNKAVWGTAVPLDAGDHVISAAAPGKISWQSIVTVKDEGSSLTVTVPPLADAPAAKAVGPKPVPADRGLGGQRIAGIVIGSAGIVGLGVGIGAGLLAKSKYDDSLAYCPDPDKPNACTAPAKPLREGALSAGTASTVAFVVGGVALAGGVVLFLTAPGRGEPRQAIRTVGVQASLGPGQAGLGLTGSF